MNTYTVEVLMTDGKRIVEEVEAGRKLEAHKILNDKYRGSYAASVILDEKTEHDGYECPICHNTEHLPKARFCMICGAPIRKEELK